MSTLDFKASYLDGRTPLRQSIDCRLENSSIVFQGPQGVRTIQLKYADIENVKDDLLYIFLDRHTGERIEVIDQALIVKIRSYSKNTYFSLSKDTGKKIFIGITLMIFIGLVVWRSTPLIAKAIANMVPVEKELLIRDKIYKSFQEQICESEIRHELLQKFISRLTEKEKNPYPAKIYLTKTADVNAFALPGGIILVNEGLVKKVGSQDALAGVIAHEMQHLIRRHILAGVIRASFMTFLWSAALGDVSGVLVIDPSTLYSIASLKYSRDDESEADQLGMEMMKNAQISVRPTLDFLDELSKPINSIGIPQFLLSHPIEDRGTKWRQLYANIETKIPVLSETDWETLKAGCPLVPRFQKTDTDTNESK